MDVSRLVLVAAAALVLAIPAAHSQEDDEAVAAQSAQARGPAKPWKFVRGLGRVLDLSKPPVVIDEPGVYVIQRNWQIPEATTNVVSEVIQITADEVTLDLHGFEISTGYIGLTKHLTMLVITGSGAEIRNGGIRAFFEGGVAVAATVGDIFGPNLHHLSISSWNTMKFEADLTTISDSSITSRGGIQMAGRSNLERNAIVGDFVCAILIGDGNRVSDNRMDPHKSDCVEILGNNNVVANNVVDASNVEHIRGAFDVRGDHNVVRNNTVLVGQDVSTVLRISGTRNTLDGNIGAPPNLPDWAPREPRARTGMEFTADGNYYGNNRMAAEVPFDLGGTVQTNWGGNVGY